jgi:hypothetical protein
VRVELQMDDRSAGWKLHLFRFDLHDARK